MKKEQFAQFKSLLKRAMGASRFYQRKYAAAKMEIEDIQSPEDIVKIPMTTKGELRQAYPLDIQAVGDEEIVRIHSSSGTTGQPIIIPYTRRDVDTWAMMMERSMRIARVTPKDRVQITPGYGLWTAGIGFQNGAERLGAMAIPMGPGNTEKQLKMMVDLRSTVLTATSSYALLLAEEISRRGIKDQIHLKTAIIGSERWGEKMRSRIVEELGVKIHDIYGLTEIYGPGISVSCAEGEGLHYWDDHLYFEIIDPLTGEVLPEGRLGELVITTLTKEGAPLIRYRTHDLTRLLPGKCRCGLAYPRHDIILGRTDDMIKIKGVNIYPGQIEDVLKGIEGASSEYQVVVDRKDGKDSMLLRVEKQAGSGEGTIALPIKRHFKTKIGIQIEVEEVALGVLPRSEKKTARVIDNRYH